MKRTTWAALVLVALTATAAAQPAGPSTVEPRPRKSVVEHPPERPHDAGTTPPIVELLTFGVGPVIFEKFGHSALCLHYADPAVGTICFNYGVTDFSGGEKLVWGFLRGKQKFWVEPVPLSHTVAFYRSEDRTIWRQVLPLTPEQARKLEDKLWNDIKEENRYYFYDHFYDNCTTRLRDMINDAFGGALREGTDGKLGRTFRDIGASNLYELTGLLALADFAVGRDLDHPPTVWESMFLPDVLRDEIAKRFNAPAEIVYERRGPAYPVKLLETPPPKSQRIWVVLGSLLFSLPLLGARLSGRLERLTRSWAALPLVLVALVIWTLAILSPIAGLRFNEALLLFVPTDVVIPFLGEARLKAYTRVRLGMVLLASLLVAIGVFKQPLWVPIFVVFQPLALMALELPGRRKARASVPAGATSAAA
jgi:hypothetical protein